MKGITLIGMPTAGKTTAGPLIAEALNWPLYDVDSIMVEAKRLPIERILLEYGHDYFRKLEASTVANLQLHDSILVTPGSIVYGIECHQQIKDQTTVVWLDVPLETLHKRIAIRSVEERRGIVGLHEKGLDALHAERQPMYEALADIRIDCEGKTPHEIADEILRSIGHEKLPAPHARKAASL